MLQIIRIGRVCPPLVNFDSRVLMSPSSVLQTGLSPSQAEKAFTLYGQMPQRRLVDFIPLIYQRKFHLHFR